MASAAKVTLLVVKDAVLRHEDVYYEDTATGMEDATYHLRAIVAKYQLNKNLRAYRKNKDATFIQRVGPGIDAQTLLTAADVA